MKTNHLSIILGALLLSPVLTACSPDTLAQPIENKTATQLPKQKAMTPEEEKIIETIKEIFKAMAEPGITSRDLLNRFGKPDPKWHNVAFPFNKSFNSLQVPANSQDSSFVNYLELELAPNTLISTNSLEKVFGNYREYPRQHWNSPRDIVFNGKLPEVPGYICRLIVQYQFKHESDKTPPDINFSFSIYPDQ